MLEYSVKKISEISENDLYNFYKTAFKDRYKILIKNYKWWYRLDDNKYPPIFITLKNYPTHCTCKLTINFTPINPLQNLMRIYIQFGPKPFL